MFKCVTRVHITSLHTSASRCIAVSTISVMTAGFLSAHWPTLKREDSADLNLQSFKIWISLPTQGQFEAFVETKFSVAKPSAVVTACTTSFNQQTLSCSFHWEKNWNKKLEYHQFLHKHFR